jgi:MFS family permease
VNIFLSILAMRFSLSRDGWLLFATCGVRSFAYGFLSVILGLYLDAIGLSPASIGWIFTAALAGSAAMTMLISSVADRFGRKALLIVGAVLMALAGWVFAVSNDPILLTIAAILGTISPSGKDVGPFLSIEQAILPQTTSDQNRTAVFSAYNLVGSFAGAIGTLAVALPELFSLTATSGYRLLIWSYIGAAILLAILFALFSPRIEAKRIDESASGKSGVQKSRPVVAKLAGLFALDAFAGGFIVQSIVAYWFYLRFKTDLSALGGIFFGTNLLAALSFLAAPAIARRFGLLNTMVFTHLPSNFLILFVPLMPNLESAVTVLLLRHLPFTNGRADAPVVHDGCRRCRRARRIGRDSLRRPQRRRGAGAAIHGRHSSETDVGTAIFVGGWTEGCLRSLDLCRVSQCETAGGK